MLTPETTSGYTQFELDDLNTEWLDRVDQLDPDRTWDDDEEASEFKAFSDVVSRRIEEVETTPPTPGGCEGEYVLPSGSYARKLGW